MKKANALSYTQQQTALIQDCLLANIISFLYNLFSVGKCYNFLYRG